MSLLTRIRMYSLSNQSQLSKDKDMVMKILAVLSMTLALAIGCVSNMEQPTPTPMWTTIETPTPFPTLIRTITPYTFPIGESEHGTMIVYGMTDKSQLADIADTMEKIEMFGTPSFTFKVGDDIQVTIKPPENLKYEVPVVFTEATKYVLDQFRGPKASDFSDL